MPHRRPTLRRLILAALVAVTGALQAASCASGGQSLPGGGEDNLPDQICLLNNCGSDLECGACEIGRRTCLVEERRCVACNPDTGVGCAEGEVCSRWGDCIADGATCPTDEHGDPMISCGSSKDCLPCDPAHHICDPATSRCVGCTPEDMSACQSTDTCVEGACVPQCPYSCTTDDDCASCAGLGYEATVCNAHKCSECSPERPCPAGETCTPQGTCVSVCGTDGVGACTGSSDCTGCVEGFVCHEEAGTCGPNAASCGQVGTTTPVVPAPWDGVSKQCTSDAQCAGLNVKLNLGAMLRDITGIMQLGDADVGYEMGTCTDVTIQGGATCGVCVPCEVDADCAPINADLVGDQLFGPPGSVEAAYLADQLFGPNEHMVYMYCEPVGAGYGVCSVCPGYLNDCRTGGGGGGGTCDHDTCTSGGPLSGDCDACAAAVCAEDSYCCTTAWDQICIDEVAQYCPEVSCGGGPVGCAHSECVTGGALTTDCSACAATVCAADDYCCTNAWDSICVNQAATLCSIGCGGGTCVHSECEVGPALTLGCSSCVDLICADDPFCCDTLWDPLCIDHVAEQCAFTCP